MDGCHRQGRCRLMDLASLSTGQFFFCHHGARSLWRAGRFSDSTFDWGRKERRWRRFSFRWVAVGWCRHRGVDSLLRFPVGREENPSPEKGKSMYSDMEAQHGAGSISHAPIGDSRCDDVISSQQVHRADIFNEDLGGSFSSNWIKWTVPREPFHREIEHVTVWFFIWQGSRSAVGERHSSSWSQRRTFCLCPLFLCLRSAEKNAPEPRKGNWCRTADGRK